VTTLSIGQLARLAGVHLETVRYYERRGLLPEPPRSPAGYRQYSRSDLWRLQFIGRAKQLGFTLSEISQLVGSDEHGSAEAVLEIARAKIHSLEERQKELAEIRSRLVRLIDVCDGPNSQDCLGLRITG
jgi:MerR family copper efflux transcriptional regulator